ncbi:hypothetical protein [Streptomyces sp. NPDC058374]|uniref:hypothetical protein n=1 Tax=unclassified Streptomyces TaxID=2593676 RepID=UPI00364EC5A9
MRQRTPSAYPSDGEIEAFLAVEEERARARRAAEALADLVPRLSAVQRDALVRRYTHDRLALAQDARARLDRQRAAQEARDRLRRRCATTALLLGAFCTALSVLALLTMAA